MLGLEDLPHAAASQFIQDRVVAQDQPASLALKNCPSLETCQAALAVKQLGQIVGLLRLLAGGQIVYDRLHLIPGHQPGRDQVLDELSQRCVLSGFLLVLALDGFQLMSQLTPLRFRRIAQAGFDIRLFPSLQIGLELSTEPVDLQQGRNRQRAFRNLTYLDHHSNPLQMDQRAATMTEKSVLPDFREYATHLGG